MTINTCDVHTHTSENEIAVLRSIFVRLVLAALTMALLLWGSGSRANAEHQPDTKGAWELQETFKDQDLDTQFRLLERDAWQKSPAQTKRFQEHKAREEARKLADEIRKQVRDAWSSYEPEEKPDAKPKETSKRKPLFFGDLFASKKTVATARQIGLGMARGVAQTAAKVSREKTEELIEWTTKDDAETGRKKANKTFNEMIDEYNDAKNGMSAKEKRNRVFQQIGWKILRNNPKFKHISDDALTTIFQDVFMGEKAEKKFQDDFGTEWYDPQKPIELINEKDAREVIRNDVLGANPQQAPARYTDPNLELAATRPIRKGNAPPPNQLSRRIKALIPEAIGNFPANDVSVVRALELTPANNGDDAPTLGRYIQAATDLQAVDNKELVDGLINAEIAKLREEAEAVRLRRQREMVLVNQWVTRQETVWNEIEPQLIASGIPPARQWTILTKVVYAKPEYYGPRVFIDSMNPTLVVNQLPSAPVTAVTIDGSDVANSQATNAVVEAGVAKFQQTQTRPYLVSADLPSTPTTVVDHGTEVAAGPVVRAAPSVSVVASRLRPVVRPVARAAAAAVTVGESVRPRRIVRAPVRVVAPAVRVVRARPVVTRARPIVRARPVVRGRVRARRSVRF